jgi:hypothetical protein
MEERLAEQEKRFEGALNRQMEAMLQMCRHNGMEPASGSHAAPQPPSLRPAPLVLAASPVSAIAGLLAGLPPPRRV